VPFPRQGHWCEDSHEEGQDDERLSQTKRRPAQSAISDEDPGDRNRGAMVSDRLNPLWKSR